MVKRRPDGVVVSKDAHEKPPKPEEEKKERPTKPQDSLLDNLVDRTKDFAEDVEYEQEGDPNGIAEGTATEAKAGDIYRGQLAAVLPARLDRAQHRAERRDKLKCTVRVRVADDGHARSAWSSRSRAAIRCSTRARVDAVQALIDASAVLPEPPAELRDAVLRHTIASTRCRFRRRATRR